MYPMNPLNIGTTNYNPYYTNPVNSMVPNYQPVIPAQGPHMEIQRVNGKESAYAYSIGPNSSVILVDNLAPKIWIVTTDSSGYKAITGFKIIPDDEESAEPIQIEETKSDEDPEYIKKLIERIDKLEERIESYGQSNSEPSWQSKSVNGNAQPNDRNSQISKGSYVNNKSNGGK